MQANVKPKKCTIKKIENRHYEVLDPNNPDNPEVGPYEGRNDKEAREAAKEAAKGLNDFYGDKKKWKIWISLQQTS